MYLSLCPVSSFFFNLFSFVFSRLRKKRGEEIPISWLLYSKTRNKEQGRRKLEKEQNVFAQASLFFVYFSPMPVNPLAQITLFFFPLLCSLDLYDGAVWCLRYFQTPLFFGDLTKTKRTKFQPKKKRHAGTITLYF